MSPNDIILRSVLKMHRLRSDTGTREIQCDDLTNAPTELASRRMGGCMAGTIYEKYGGFGAISRVVMDFYDKLLDSDEIGPFFDNVDMKRLIDHQTKFVAHLLGGPADYSDERLEALHAHLNIGSSDFDEMKRLLDETLADHGFDDEDRATVGSAIEARRSKIVR